MIIAIRGEGLVEGADDDGDEAGASSNQRLTYGLHPNCGIFDDE